MNSIVVFCGRCATHFPALSDRCPSCGEPSPQSRLNTGLKVAGVVVFLAVLGFVYHLIETAQTRGW
jgi:hypothetical protein